MSQANDLTEREPAKLAHTRDPRSKVLKGAHAAFNQEHSAVPCIVRDVSETGAKIEFDLGWIVPNHFTLFVEVDGYKVECEKVWHDGKLYGVRFTGPKMQTSLGRHQEVNYYDMKQLDQEPKLQEAAPSQPETMPRPSFGHKPRKPVFGKLK